VNVDGPVITATLGLDSGASGSIVDGVATTTEFTNGTADFAFTTGQALDEGDTVTFRLSDGTDSVDITYTQTATGTSETTAEELSAQLADAYTAFAARNEIGNTNNPPTYRLGPPTQSQSHPPCPTANG